MAHVIDTRSAGGQLIILGEFLTIPTSNTVVSSPPQGSLRYNPVTSVIEYFSNTSIWNAFTINYVSNSYNLFNNYTSQPVGSTGYATDGCKPSERIANTAGSGIPVFWGFLTHANLISDTPTWISTMDGEVLVSN